MHKVKNPTAAARVTVEVRVQPLAQCSGLRIRHCYSYGVGSDSIPIPGTSMCCRHTPPKKKKVSERWVLVSTPFNHRTWKR